MEYDLLMEARGSKFEAAVEHIQRDLTELKADVRSHRKETARDFRILFSAIITVALGLASVIAKAFHWL
jgi:uncharacterized protein YydD (DUF2326 family)